MPEDLLDDPAWTEYVVAPATSTGERRDPSGRSHYAPHDPACPVCNGLNVVGHRNNLSECLRCNHVFQSDLLVTMVYDAAYAHQYDHRPHRAMSALRWNFIQHWLGLAEGSRILDVGYGNGAFLTYAREHGMSVFGIDVHGENFGIPHVDYDVTLKFDLVCFFDSLEHFPKFDRLFGLQAKNVIVSIPSAPDFLLQTPESWRHYKPGEHMHYFSRLSLDRLMRRWGMTTKVVEAHPEDELRGKLNMRSIAYDNILTAIYRRDQCL